MQNGTTPLFHGIYRSAVDTTLTPDWPRRLKINAMVRRLDAYTVLFRYEEPLGDGGVHDLA